MLISINTNLPQIISISQLFSKNNSSTLEKTCKYLYDLFLFHKGKVYVSQSRLAAQSGVVRATINRVCKFLSEKNFICMDSGKKTFETNDYYISEEFYIYLKRISRIFKNKNYAFHLAYVLFGSGISITEAERLVSCPNPFKNSGLITRNSDVTPYSMKEEYYNKSLVRESRARDGLSTRKEGVSMQKFEMNGIVREIDQDLELTLLGKVKLLLFPEFIVRSVYKSYARLANKPRGDAAVNWIIEGCHLVCTQHATQPNIAWYEAIIEERDLDVRGALTQQKPKTNNTGSNSNVFNKVAPTTYKNNNHSHVSKLRPDPITSYASRDKDLQRSLERRKRVAENPELKAAQEYYMKLWGVQSEEGPSLKEVDGILDWGTLEKSKLFENVV